VTTGTLWTLRITINLLTITQSKIKNQKSKIKNIYAYGEIMPDRNAENEGKPRLSETCRNGAESFFRENVNPDKVKFFFNVSN
jgi:hypothetical protein